MSYIKRVRYMTNCPPYVNPKKITPTKATLHSTGCAQQKILPYFNGENKASTNAAVHGFIGEDTDGTICFVQTLPLNYRGWHVGSGSLGSYNNNGPGIEVCEPSGGQKYSGGTIIDFDKEKYRGYFNETRQIAIEVFGDICKEFKLNPYTDIVDHQEAHKLGYGSNHGDIKHWWDKIYGYTLDDFRKDVATYMAYDKTGKPDETTENTNQGAAAQRLIYRVQTGAFSKKENAYVLESKLLAEGFETCIAKADGYYKVQVGAFSVKANAQSMAEKLKAKGYSAFITTKENRPASGTIGYVPTTKLTYTTGKYQIAVVQGLNVRTGPSTEYPKKSLSELTEAAQKQGGYKYGVVFTALEVVNGTKEAWARTPSGWVCLELNGDKYVAKC